MSNFSLVRAAKLIVLGVFLSVAASSAFAEAKHKIALHVDENNEATMNLALNNIANVVKYYQDKGEEVSVELVTYGPGLNMLRDDTSPVKDRIKSFGQNFENVSFRACGNTYKKMQEKEKKEIKLIPEAKMVPSGVITLIELQEQGYSYVKP